MVNLERVAREIKNVGLYNLILQDVQKILKKNRVSEEEILKVLKTHPEVLEEYKQLNIGYNLSNIHVKDIECEKLKEKCKDIAKKINENLSIMRNIEKYTLDFEQSPTLIFIFSAEFFVLFSVQYFIVLLNLKEWQWYIYAFFLMSVIVAWIYAKKERKVYEKNAKIFEERHKETLELFEKLEKECMIKKCDFYIHECEDHV